MSSNLQKAEALKAKGNEKYRVGAYAEAIDFYNTAVALQTEEPVYLSNLSAAQLEDGQYAEALKSCGRALSLVGSHDPQQAKLRSKLLNRRSKLLSFLCTPDPMLFADASTACDDVLIDNPESPSAFAQKDSLERRRLAQTTEGKIDQRITDVPRYRCPLKPVMEYYTVGHDDTNSIFRVQYTSNDDITEKHPYAERFHMTVPRDRSPFNFSAMFCGMGDARHIYASFADIGQDLKHREKACKGKVPANINIHFTMNDIHPTALSRDLIVLTLLVELSTIPTAQHESDPRALDLLLALHYVYWGTTMPPRAHEILEQVLNKVAASVKDAADQGVALVFDWLYIEPNTVKEMDVRLRWWQGEGKTALSFDAILPPRLESDGPDISNPVFQHLQPKDRAALQSSGSKRQTDMINFMREDPRAREQCESEAKNMGITMEEYIDLVESIPADSLAMHDNTPPNAYVEREAWNHLHVMLPPPHANEPKPLDMMFRVLRSGIQEAGGLLTKSEILDKAYQRIRKRWCINFTLLDKDWLRLNRVNIDLQHCPFRGTLGLFNAHYMLDLCPTTRKGSIYEWSARFFSLVADGVARLRACGPSALKLEIVLGDGYEILDRIRRGTLLRNPEFPTRFDRIHASNVPDYIGGYLASFTTAVPLLKPLPTSYFTSCSLLNSGVWEGGFMDGNHAMNLDSALYTYAGVTRAETPAAYGVSVDCTPVYAGNYHTFGRLSALSKRLTREQLAVVAYACFIKTVLPVKYPTYTYSGNIREVLNVHAFFRLIETLKDLGYAPHVLAEIVESILENRVKSSPRPHDVAPIALASRGKVGLLCTTPFLADFEVASAIWEPRLFPICSRLVPAPHDIVRCSVRFTMTHIPLDHSIPTTHFVLVLIFGLPDDLDADLTDFRKRVTGTANCRTSVQLVSTFSYDHESRVATFLLSRERAEGFKRAGYEVALLNTMFWRIQSKKVPCTKMDVVGDLDKWDRGHKVVTPQGRALTRRETDGWDRDIMRGFSKGHPMSSGNRMMNMLDEMGGGMGGMPNMDDMPPGFMEMMQGMLGGR